MVQYIRIIPPTKLVQNIGDNINPNTCFEHSEKFLTHCIPFSRWRYLAARRDVDSKKRFFLYERALKALPGSYKVTSLCLTSHIISHNHIGKAREIKSPQSDHVRFIAAFTVGLVYCHPSLKHFIFNSLSWLKCC